MTIESSPDLNTIHAETQTRYRELAGDSCNLSCGNNLAFLDLKPGNHLLDLGCGRGLETIRAAKLVGRTGLAVGLDLTPEMIAKAVENAAREGITNVHFMAGEIERLIFEDQSFDAVISNCAINHARNKTMVFHEIHRILKPTGKMVISDAVSKIPLPEHIKNDPEAWAACFGGAVTEWEYLQSIKTAGFDNIEILKRREYLKNGYDFISLTIRATP